MSETLVKLNGIGISFSGVQILEGIDFELKKGEIHCLIGENGSGKSTIVKIIAGVYKPDCGTVELGGRTYSAVNSVVAMEAGIQIIWQDFSLFPNLTVYENIALNDDLYNKRAFVNKAQRRELAKKALEMINVDMDLDALVENLPVAKKQLVAIARAISNNAKLVIMDEPTTSLTKNEVKALFKVIRHLQSQGVTILFISHKLDEVFDISETFSIIRNGKKVKAGLTKDFNSDDFVYYMTGRKIDTELLTVPDPEPDAVPILEVKNLSLKNEFEDVSLKVYKGEVLGITGLLGSGRTELALSIYGMHPPTSGDVYLNGEKVEIKSVANSLKKGIVYLPEDRLTEGLCMRRSIMHNMYLSSYDSFKKNGKGAMDVKKMEEETKKWVDKFHIVAANIHNAIRTLSGGNAQKVLLSRLMSLDPKVLLLNMPTVGVDVGAKFDIHAEIRRIAAEGVGAIVISDDLEEVYKNCNRIMVMQKGRITHALKNTETSIEELGNIISGQTK